MKNSSGKDDGTPRSFNLVDEPWIPVVDAEGATFKVGLRELFERSDELIDLSVGTLERITLYRLLICIAQRALNGPKDEDEWREAEGKLVAASLAYLDEQRDRFDLWGERPFLQVKALEAVGRTKTDKLDFGLASGNNNTLFDQTATEDGRAHEPDWLARNLLVYLAFSPGGRIGVATINGRETDGGGSSANAPCVESCMLFAFLQGANLRQTIAWNMVSFDRLTYFPSNVGKPVWEFDAPFTEDVKKTLASSWFGRLVPVARFIRLEEDGRNMILANGVSYLKLEEGVREPMATVLSDEKKNEWKYARTDAERKPWRQLGSMLTWSVGLGGGPMNLHKGDVRADGENEIFKVWTGGLATDKAKVVDTASWRVEIPWLYLSDKVVNDAITKYKKGVETSEVAEKRLAGAVKRYCDSLNAEAQKEWDKKNVASCSSEESILDGARTPRRRVDRRSGRRRRIRALAKNLKRRDARRLRKNVSATNRASTSSVCRRKTDFILA
ncbi:MAG: type I-E CRISPR-associated protein Cse1/CasA [Thermoguttaceae bacterium]|nr:type I-E CRISPR-associated protein Cse1/CasA [Thermoguttaceae bacterium]